MGNFGHWCWGLAVGVGVWPLVLWFGRFFSFKMGSVLSSALFPTNMVFAVSLEKPVFFLAWSGEGCVGLP